MLKVMRDNKTFIVPQHWIGINGFLTYRAVYALKVFFGDCTKAKALEKTNEDKKFNWRLLTKGGLSDEGV